MVKELAQGGLTRAKEVREPVMIVSLVWRRRVRVNNIVINSEVCFCDKGLTSGR